MKTANCLLRARTVSILRVLAVSVIPLLSVSCARYAPLVSQSTIPNRMIVLYGRLQFTDNITTNDTTFLRGYRMGLRLVNEDTQKQVLIRFGKRDPLSCVSVDSGTYKIAGFIVTDGAGFVLEEKDFQAREAFAAPFKVRPNTAPYLGDFSGYAELHFYGLWPADFKAGITEVTNNYLETTRMFHQKYPRLESLPVHSIFNQSP